MTTRTIAALAAVLILAATGCAQKGDLRDAEKARDDARAALKTAQAELASARADLKTAQSQLASARADVTSKQREIDTLTARVTAAERAKTTAEQALEAARTSGTVSQAELIRLRQQLATANTALTAARRDLATANSDRTALRSQVTTLTARVSELETQLAEAGTDDENGNGNGEPTNVAVTMDEIGTARRAGVSTYAESRVGGRFPGVFSGTRPVYSLDDWGFWAKQGDATLFKAFIKENESLFSTDEYALMVEGTPSGSNPVSGSAVWTGKVRAYDAHPRTLGTPVSGDARLEADLSGAMVDVDFTNFTGGHGNISWDNLSLTNGAFQYQSGYNTLSGAFYGAEHEGVAGKFTRDRLDGVFGATRE